MHDFNIGSSISKTNSPSFVKWDIKLKTFELYIWLAVAGTWASRHVSPMIVTPFGVMTVSSG